MKDMIKDALILFAITVIAGLALGGVYEITKEPISLAKEAAAKEAYKEVFAQADSFEEIGAISEADINDLTENGFSDVSIDSVLTAKDSSDEMLGYVILVTSHAGYGGDITFTMGVTNDGTLNGISILSISETAGLGMRAEEVLKPQFANKNVESFTVTKTGATSDAQIDAISGATITSKAVTNAVNAGLYYFNNKLGGAN